MLKKIVLGIAFVGLIGVLIYGAVLRTNAKTSSGDGQEHGSGAGLGRGRANTVEGAEVAASAPGRGNGGSGQGNAAGRQASAEGQPADWLRYEGVAIRVNDSELLIEVSVSELVLVEGRAWSYALQQGADVQAGHAVVATGFVEDGEFKVGSLHNLVTGQQIAVRDANGRPLWSGGGRGSQ